MKIRPLGTELFHADRRTDRRDEACFSNFANTPKKSVALSLPLSWWLLKL
jgi:hypothetical protein